MLYMEKIHSFKYIWTPLKRPILRARGLQALVLATMTANACCHGFFSSSLVASGNRSVQQSLYCFDVREKSCLKLRLILFHYLIDRLVQSCQFQSTISLHCKVK